MHIGIGFIFCGKREVIHTYPVLVNLSHVCDVRESPYLTDAGTILMAEMPCCILFSSFDNSSTHHKNEIERVCQCIISLNDLGSLGEDVEKGKIADHQHVLFSYNVFKRLRP